MTRTATAAAIAFAFGSMVALSIPHHMGHGTKYIDLSYQLLLRLVVCLLGWAAAACSCGTGEWASRY